MTSPLSRPLTADERRILDALLGQDFPGADALRAQLPHVTVVGGCDCGCATVELEVNRSACEPAPPMRSPIRSEATVLDEGSQPIGGIIVFLQDGYLSMLEVYANGADPIAKWPPPERMELSLRDE